MDLQLQQKNALVFGASQGLGRAIAVELAAAGAKLCLASRSEEKLQQLAQTLRQQHQSTVEVALCDVNQSESLQTSVDCARQQGVIDVLLLNAGGPPMANFNELNDQHFYAAFEQNFMSVVRTLRLALPHLNPHGARVGIITSLSVKEPIAGLLLSNCMRAAVTGLAKTLASELTPHLINTFAPGSIATERIESINQSLAQKQNKTLEQVRSLAQQNIPLKRYGTPAEFARSVIFYLSPANTYVTGQLFSIDGGKSRGLF